MDKQVKVANYSLGMKQRLGIAQALMGDPTMIILDEPFNGLDNQGIELLIEIIEELKLRNKLVLLTSHRNEDLQRVCTNFIKLIVEVFQELRYRMMKKSKIFFFV